MLILARKMTVSMNHRFIGMGPDSKGGRETERQIFFESLPFPGEEPFTLF
jgi:hypothetical protein